MKKNRLGCSAASAICSIGTTVAIPNAAKIANIANAVVVSLDIFAKHIGQNAIYKEID
jgi:hypothetical protein